MKKLLLMWIMLLGMGGVISAQTPTKEVKKPIILKGGKSSFTTNCYVIEMQGWQNFIAYEDAEGVAFDENSTMVFDVAKPVANGNVRVRFFFDDGTHTECWWCLGIGTSADDTSQAYWHSFDNSTVYIKKLLGDNFEAKKDCKITKVTVDNYNGNDGGLVVYEVRGGTICGENMTIKKDAAKSIGCYAGTFTPTAAFTNIFQYKPLAIEDFQKIVVKFEEAVPATGGWKINDNRGFYSLDGKTEYVIELNGENGEDIRDFTIFNWNENPDPIKISEVYFYKEVVMNSSANTELLNSATVTGVDSETQLIGEGKWIFDSPIDIASWQYLVITTSQSAANTSAKITITDNNGVSATQDDNTHDNFKSMCLDRWNNQNALCIDLSYLATSKGLDLTSIKSIKIDGYWGGSANIYLSQMYLTNYLSTKIAEGSTWHVGDVVREYNAEGVGKFGTICLPYAASCSGAEIYSIVGKTSNSITLEKATGLMEAGKPYFYKAVDEIGKYNGNTPTDIRNVNFFRADLDTYDVATPIENNGLIGTFTATPAPQGENFYVLSGNKLYNTVGSEVNVGANKAYIDMNKIVNQSSEAKNRISIDFGNAEATGIESVNDTKVLNSGKMYDLSGREVTNPTSGIYIMGGKKIIIK